MVLPIRPEQPSLFLQPSTTDGTTSGLTDEQASALAIEACKGIPWANRKFITDNTPEQFWKEDDLFRVPAEFLPTRDKFESALGEIYSCRGKLLHGGHSFPASSVIGMGPMIPIRAAVSLGSSSNPFPPIVWFERAINLAINTFVERSLPPKDTTDGSQDKDSTGN